MGFVFFIIGVRVEIALLVLLPFFIGMLGTAVAIGLVIALPLVGAVLILIGIVQGDPEGRRSRDHRAISCSPLIGTPQPRNRCADPLRPVIGARRRPPCGAPTVRFAADSLLEGNGFELLVPHRRRSVLSSLFVPCEFSGWMGVPGRAPPQDCMYTPTNSVENSLPSLSTT